VILSTRVAPCWVSIAGVGIIRRGQRRGLGISLGERMTVLHKDSANNIVVLGAEEEAMIDSLELRDVASIDQLSLNVQCGRSASFAGANLSRPCRSRSRRFCVRSLRVASPFDIDWSICCFLSRESRSRAGVIVRRDAPNALNAG